MLGKLTKYEFKSTVRIFPMLFAGLVILSLINRFMYHGLSSNLESSGLIINLEDSNWIVSLITGMSSFLYGLLIFGTMAAMLIVTIQRFRTNLLGSEGYLMFTLPVRSWQLLLSKMLAMAVWCFCSIFFVTLSAFIVSGVSVSELFREIGAGMAEIVSNVGTGGIIEIVLAGLITLLVYALPIFVSIAIGSLWRKHRTLGAFLSFIGLSIVSQGIFGSVMYSIVNSRLPFDYSLATEVERIARTRADMHAFMIPLLILLVIYAAACFFVTTSILDKKLDLE